MTTEEKAKRYDEAIKKAEVLYKTAEPMSGCNVIIETLFPELKESEDEKIRKDLIQILQNALGVTQEWKSKVIAWLEKQAFNTYNANKEYWRGYREGKQEILDKYAELEKQGEQKSIVEMKSPEESLGIDSDTYNKIVDECIYGEQKFAETEKGAKGNDREIPFSGQEWSEEDEMMLDTCIDLIEHFPRPCGRVIGPWKDCIDWLKSLRPQNRWKPSEEQMDAILFVVQHYTPKVTDKLAWDSIKILELMYYEIKQ